MLQLHEDINFHYETMRAIGTIPYHGADIGEVLEIMQKLKSGDWDSWYDEWNSMALRVLSTIDQTKENSYSPVTLREVYFRVSHYIFVADFFLHGNRGDPRLNKSFNGWRKYFDKANALLPIPGKRFTIKSDGFEMPVMIFRAAEASTSQPRPTLIIGGGFESVMEETMHVYGFAALERGYNVVLYEGPGHRTLIETQGKGFIAEWEKAVTPVVDFIFAHKQNKLSFIDTDKLGLVGMSLGGVLAARAAAFEPRLAAVMCIDGVYDFLDCCMNILPQVKGFWEAGDKAAFDAYFVKEVGSTNQRWLQDNLRGIERRLLMASLQLRHESPRRPLMRGRGCHRENVPSGCSVGIQLRPPAARLASLLQSRNSVVHGFGGSRQSLALDSDLLSRRSNSVALSRRSRNGPACLLTCRSLRRRPKRNSDHSPWPQVPLMERSAVELGHGVAGPITRLASLGTVTRAVAMSSRGPPPGPQSLHPPATRLASLGTVTGAVAMSFRGPHPGPQFL